jgi:hypothetical protein
MKPWYRHRRFSFPLSQTVGGVEDIERPRDHVGAEVFASIVVKSLARASHEA